MASYGTADFGRLVMALFRFRAAINLSIATTVLLAYEHILTFSDEITLVWPSRWSLTKILFFYNRYSPYVDVTLSLQMLLGPHSYITCKRSYIAVAYLVIVGTTVSETILMIRTYALWNRDKRVLWCFVIMMAIVFPTNIVITLIFFGTLNYIPSPVPTLAPCFAPYLNNIIWLEFLLFSLTETIIVILTFIKGYDHLRHVRTRLVYTLYEDGLLYYICFLSISIANVIMLFFAPLELKNALVSPLRIFHSILSTRVILHIRACVNDRQMRYKLYDNADGSASPCTCVCTCAPQRRNGGGGVDDAARPEVALWQNAANCPECACNCGREWGHDWRWWRTWDAEPMSVAEFTFTHQLVAELGDGGAGDGAGTRERREGDERGERWAEADSLSVRDTEYGASWINWMLHCASWPWTRFRSSESHVRGRERHPLSRSRSHSLASPTSATQFTYPRRLGKGILTSSAGSLRLPVLSRSASRRVMGAYDDDECKQQDIEMEELPSPVSVAGSGSALMPMQVERRKIGDG